VKLPETIGTSNIITSVQNPLIKDLRKLQQVKYARTQGQFLLEGTNLVTEAIAACHPLTIICHTAAWQGKHPQIWQQLVASAIRVQLVSEEVIAAVATTVTPDGIVAAAKSIPRPTPSFPSPLIVAADNIQDPGNMGTIIRTIAGVGANGLIASSDSVDFDRPKVLRSSAGQWFRVPMAVSQDLASDIVTARREGMQVVATTSQADRDYWQVDFSKPTLLLLGNEGGGLKPALTGLADIRASIPMAEGIESLNVAIAAALLAYEWRRQMQRV
jgi:TrmH family RNA methyltransferase